MRTKAPSENDSTLDELQGDRARHHILDSAIKVFSQKGFEGASLREIARQADINHAMIKYYFGGKEPLWKAAVDFLFQRQLRELDPEAIVRDSAGDPRRKLRLLCEQLIRYWARYPEHSRLVLQASMTPGPCLDWILEQTRRNHGIFRGIFGDDPGDADTDTVTTVATLYLLVGACQNVFTLEHEVRSLYGIDVSDPAFVDRFVDIALHMLTPAETTDAPATRGEPALSSRRTSAGLELTIVIPDH